MAVYRRTQRERRLRNLPQEPGTIFAPSGAVEVVLPLFSLRSPVQCISDFGLKRVLQIHAESELANAFVVVEPGQHRFRKLE